MCPDPLGDTGGDHDLYDYCVDDPVSLYDPTGLSAVTWCESDHPRNDDGTFASKGEAGSQGQKEPELPLWRRFLGKYSPILFLPDGHPDKEKARAALLKQMEKKTREFGTSVLDATDFFPNLPELLLKTHPQYNSPDWREEYREKKSK